MTDWSGESAAILRSATNFYTFVPRKCSNSSKRAELRQIGLRNVQQSVVARRIGTDWSREFAAIRSRAPNCDRLVPRIGPVVALPIATDWSPECAAIRRSALNCDRLVTYCAGILRSAPNCDTLVTRICCNPLWRAELRQIGSANVQQSVVALPIARLLRRMCRNRK